MAKAWALFYFGCVQAMRFTSFCGLHRVCDWIFWRSGIGERVVRDLEKTGGVFRA